MQTGFVGLGRMGLNMVTRLLEGGHEVVAFNRSPGPAKKAGELGAVVAGSLEELVARLSHPRHVWLMVPAGGAVDETIDALCRTLEPGDCIIDGGNSNYKETVKRAGRLKDKGIRLLDVGVSGGVWGLKEGYCMMAGGEAGGYEEIEPLLKTLAPAGAKGPGYAYMGESGAGHYVKMIHNGIEYGMLQAYAEGFALLEASKYDLNLEKTAALWGTGSVIRSWLLELAVLVFQEDPALEGIKPYVEDSGEGRWTVLDSLEKDVPCPVITLSLLERFRSRQGSPFSARVIAALRNQFGGHAVKK